MKHEIRVGSLQSHLGACDRPVFRVVNDAMHGRKYGPANKRTYSQQKSCDQK